MTLPVNPEPGSGDPGRMPPAPPFGDPAPPVREPDPDRLPDEVPLPNPDENPEPPQSVGDRWIVATPKPLLLGSFFAV